MFLGIDIGTSSSKAVAVTADGAVLASATRPHRTEMPHPGWFEHDADAVWWQAVAFLVAEVMAAVPEPAEAVCVSGIGPCALPGDRAGRPLRPAILYGIDTRAAEEIEELTQTIGVEEILRHCGNILSSQSVLPKLLWVARHEPETFAAASTWFSCSSYLVHRLTGEYVTDHHTASTADPLYDLTTGAWWDVVWDKFLPGFAKPRLAWPGEIVGTVHAEAAAATGLALGTPVLAGTIDALAEAYSVGCRDVGDTMVMYGSTMFLIQTTAAPVTHPGLWSVAGRVPATSSVSAGMATSGLVTTWLADSLGQDVESLVSQASAVAPGSDGLVLLPYFAGERTPLFDSDARGCWLGLTLRHGPGHLYRSVLEGVAYGVRHNLEAMAEAGAQPSRLVAVGGGTRGDLWTRIVSDVTGLPQDLPTTTVGACFGNARAAADALGIDTSEWNPVAIRIEPNSEVKTHYNELYNVYRRTYPMLRENMHRLSRLG